MQWSGVAGTGANKVLILGDRVNSFPLEKVLRRAGLKKENFWIASDPEYITKLSPKAVLAMGDFALQQTVFEGDILRHRGRVQRHPSGTWIIPTLHPGDLLPKRSRGDGALRNPARFTGAVIWDVHKALSVAKDGFCRNEPHYMCDPSPEEFSTFVLAYEDALRRDASVMLSWDIETPYKLKKGDEDEFDESERDVTILRISFSYAAGTGVSVPWNGLYLPSIRRLLRSRGVHVVWNGDAFDVPLVRANGVEVLGEVQDYMWGWHIYQSDLPMGLEFVSSFFSDILPWKHLSQADPARYSAIDADAALRNAIGIRDALRRTGQWDIFHRHVVELDPVLYQAGEAGNKIDLNRQAQLRQDLMQEKLSLATVAQGMVPNELKPKRIWKKPPSDLQGLRPFQVPAQVKTCSICRLQNITKSAHYKGGKKNPCHGGEMVKTNGFVTQWEETLEFNPNSSEQIKEYIRFYSHPMGMNKQDRSREAADRKHLDKLVKKHGHSHPVYQLVIDYHKVSKALSTYVEGFRPDTNGLIHTTYTHAPSTWRLSSRNVNLQNVGKREDNKWAKEARKQIIAHEGHVLVQADSSAIEAVFVGYYMADPDYIRLARIGVHDYLTCFALGIKVAAKEFTKDHIKRAKALHGEPAYKEMRERAKRVVHGTSYGMGPNLMCNEYPEIFPTKLEAETWQTLLFTVIPGLKAWQHKVRLQAHKEGYLENPWKIRHYFYNVFSMDMASGEVKFGDDAKRCVAFLPQSAAGCFMQDNLLLLSKTWLGPYMPANVSVHDSLCVDVLEARREEAEQVLVDILTRPIPEMGGLQVGCETEWGLNWGEMNTIRKVEIAA